MLRLGCCKLFASIYQLTYNGFATCSLAYRIVPHRRAVRQHAARTSTSSPQTGSDDAARYSRGNSRLTARNAIYQVWSVRRDAQAESHSFRSSRHRCFG